MPNLFDSRLETRLYPVDSLVDMVVSGTIRIPSFQRGLKWGRTDVVRLFESIVKDYPIGNILLWQREAGAVKGLQIGSLRIDAPALTQAFYVVDGQQRLTSLANALSVGGTDDQRFALSFDVRNRRFVPPVANAPELIPLSTIFHLPSLLRWFSDHPELQSEPALIDNANSAAKSIREYRVPVYITDHSDEQILRDIFDRMNNYGKKLTRAEVFTALHESVSGERVSSDEKTDFDEIANVVHARTGFGMIDQQTVFLAMLARRGSDISRDIRKEFVDADDKVASEFAGETPEEARLRLTDALVAAVSFLQLTAKVPHLSFLPYRFLLVVLTRFFAHFPTPEAANRRNLNRWFWRASAIGPEFTKGNLTQASRALSGRIIPGHESSSVHGLLQQIGPRPHPLRVATAFRTNYADTRLVLSALWERGPRRFTATVGNAQRYGIDELLDSLGETNSAVELAPMILRTSSLTPAERALPSNRVLLPDNPTEQFESVLQLIQLQVRRLQLGESSAREILESHLISPEAGDLLLAGDLKGFLQIRQDQLQRYVLDFLARQTEWDFEDTPPIADLNLDDEPSPGLW